MLLKCGIVQWNLLDYPVVTDDPLSVKVVSGLDLHWSLRQRPGSAWFCM